ncbi:MHYT domain-containing protein [Hoeflea prorocentri]|uniref:LytTR family transcriptional regulator DNA-binding domain-containing protein n=1 Tax=Hoeflea prorocentri TaxID=1922333 RepID=A0A9X3ZFS1_9HYPH|nr:MHYT domain-containing protein [Hoeflea prorocentri]MCY6379167.1 LytTR family transcriptional regulator DNA-binding domain-containing protein [Hoeflea prorocentri]MDA5396968.1 LytTR family transcriptional regulator DNA-binding domain-containing protein [Hoeflea prorocentri]
MVEVHYSPFLVGASILVAIMAAFTCLRLTDGLRNLPVPRRKLRIAQAAIALGGGIWSMHFIGMLAVTLPFFVTYDPLLTLSSALIAILITGCGLLLLHFGERTNLRILTSGSLTGIGIASMHYTGMAAISANCIVTYSARGIISSVVIAIAASTLAMWLAYSTRSLLRTAIGAVVLGLSISAMHYAAMLGTSFAQAAEFVAEPIPALDPQVLAMSVSLSAFVICGLFLLLAVPMEEAGKTATAEGPDNAEPVQTETEKRQPARAQSVPLSRAGQMISPAKNSIPYEKEGTVRFMNTDRILAIESDGHYTKIRTDEDALFCPWSLSKVEKSQLAGRFLKTHRRYLVNPAHINGLKKVGDQLFCYVGEAAELEVPVSRSRAKDLRNRLGV